MFTDILQQIFDIAYGARVYLPETKIVIAIAIGLALLIYFKGPLGGLVTSILVTILVSESFLSESNLDQISLEKAFAGLVIGLIAFFTILYFIVRTLADWKD